MRTKSNMLRMFLLTFKLSKKFYFMSVTKALVMALKGIVAVYGLSLIITKLAEGDIYGALYYAGAIIAAEVVLKYFELTLTTYTEIESDRVQNAVTVEIVEKLMKVEYMYLEDPEYLNSAEAAKLSIQQFDALNIVMKRSVDVLTHFITIASLITIIIFFNPIILAIILVSVLLHFIVSRTAAKKQSEKYKKLIPENRKNNYFSNVINDVRYQKDFRIYPLGDLVFGLFHQYLSKNRSNLIHYYNYMGNFNVAYAVINYIQIFSIYMFVAYISITQGLGVGVYILLTASAIKAAGAVDLFTSNLIDIKKNIIILQPVFDVLDMEDGVTQSEDGLICKPFESLEFRNVTFSYPGTELPILNNLSLTIEKGEKISIVGFNGAGKTTIVKLISRFYTLDRGEILWNGININKYNYESYINQISAVFQDFKLFAYSISQNVDLKEDNKEYILECLNQVGLEDKINALPNGMDSLLSKQFSPEGTDMSGGEKQKIAIARAMYQGSSLAILDEPTSALDPISEAEIYEHFNELVKDKTTIYISHRMSSSIFCDRIIVLQNGVITADDTHSNLMAQKSDVYYELFSAQSSYYK